MYIANVIDGGKTGVMATLFGLRDHSNDMNIVSDIVGAPFASIQENLSNSIAQLNQAYMGSETLNMARLITMHHGSTYNPYAMSIVTKDNILDMNLRMREIVLSHPDVMKLDSLGFIDGFSDVSPDLELQNWVYDGVLRLDDGPMTYSTFSGSYDDMYDDLDKTIITETWHNIQNMLAEGIDPTSKDLSYFD